MRSLTTFGLLPTLKYYNHNKLRQEGEENQPKGLQLAAYHQEKR